MLKVKVSEFMRTAVFILAVRDWPNLTRPVDMTVLLIGRGKAQPPPTYWHHSPSHDKVNQHWRHCEETVDRGEGRTNVVIRWRVHNWFSKGNWLVFSRSVRFDKRHNKEIEIMWCLTQFRGLQNSVEFSVKCGSLICIFKHLDCWFLLNHFNPYYLFF